MLSAVSVKSDILTTVQSVGVGGTSHSTSLKRNATGGSESERKISSGREKKQTKLGFAAIVSGGWNSADLVYLEFIDFLITPNAS